MLEVPDVSANCNADGVLQQRRVGLCHRYQFRRRCGPASRWTTTMGARRISGQIAPGAYVLDQEGASSDASVFHDITVGDNDFTGTNNHTYAAGAGYDLATGIRSTSRGRPLVPQATSVTPGQSGHNVTLSGIGLDHATFTFGAAPATVVSATDTSAVVTVPAGTGTVAVTGTSSALGTNDECDVHLPGDHHHLARPRSRGCARFPSPERPSGCRRHCRGRSAAAAWPAGLTLDGATGIISGTPTAASAPVNATIALSGAGGTINLNAAFSIQIVQFASTTTPSVAPGAVALGGAVTYGATVTSTGGVPSGTVSFAIGGRPRHDGGAVGGSASCSSQPRPPPGPTR